MNKYSYVLNMNKYEKLSYINLILNIRYKTKKEMLPHLCIFINYFEYLLVI